MKQRYTAAAQHPQNRGNGNKFDSKCKTSGLIFLIVKKCPSISKETNVLAKATQLQTRYVLWPADGMCDKHINIASFLSVDRLLSKQKS